MKSEDFKKDMEVFEQIVGLKRLLKEITGDGKTHWWKIETPNSKDCQLYCNETRNRFIQFIETEIKTLKEKINLED